MGKFDDDGSTLSSKFIGKYQRKFLKNVLTVITIRLNYSFVLKYNPKKENYK